MISILTRGGQHLADVNNPRAAFTFVRNTRYHINDLIVKGKGIKYENGEYVPVRVGVALVSCGQTAMLFIDDNLERLAQAITHFTPQTPESVWIQGEPDNSWLDTPALDHSWMEENELAR